MSEFPFVSIIIPAFNAAKYLPAAIDSVLSQQNIRLQTIVINDGSTDNTLEILEKYCAEVTIVDQENSGVSAARNAGLNYVDGKYIVFLDADDIFLPKKLAIQAGFLEENPDVGAVFSDVICFQEDETGLRKTWPHKVNKKIKDQMGPPAHNQEIFLTQNILPPVAAMVRTSCVKIIGGFDTSLSGVEDWDCWYRIGAQFQMAYLNQPTALYRVHPGSLSSNLDEMQKNYDCLMDKIQKTNYYQDLSVYKQSIHQVHQGFAHLNFQDPIRAKHHFKKAIQIWPFNLLGIAGYLMVYLFGSFACTLFRLKKSVFG